MPDQIHVCEKLLDLLRCPACEDRPKVEIADGGVRCVKCGRVYPIENGVPIMLLERSAQGEQVQ